jgi:hypothetical protein
VPVLHQGGWTSDEFFLSHHPSMLHSLVGFEGEIGPEPIAAFDFRTLENKSIEKILVSCSGSEPQKKLSNFCL